MNVKKKTSDAQAVGQAVDKLAAVLSPRAPSTNSNSANSPARVVEIRTKCYKQLADLKNLNEQGVLSDAEYYNEKESVMTSLKSLK